MVFVSRYRGNPGRARSRLSRPTSSAPILVSSLAGTVKNGRAGCSARFGVVDFVDDYLKRIKQGVTHLGPD